MTFVCLLQESFQSIIHPTVIHNLHIYLRVNISKENVGQDFILRLFIFFLCWHYFLVHSSSQPSGGFYEHSLHCWSVRFCTRNTGSPQSRHLFFLFFLDEILQLTSYYSSEHLFLYVVNLLELNEIKWALNTMPIQVHIQMFCFIHFWFCVTSFIWTEELGVQSLCCILFVFIFHFDICCRLAITTISFCVRHVKPQIHKVR